MSDLVRVLVTPKDENPYQRLLYDELTAAGVVVRYLDGPTGSHTLNLLLAPLMLTRHRLSGYRILHIHWVFQFALPWAPHSNSARRIAQWWFWLYLWWAHTIGYRILWTAHDLLPHSRVFFDDRQARRYLIDRADAIIALSQASAPELIELGARDVEVVPFGSYATVYESALGRQAARSELGLGPSDVVVLLIGKIEPYKGADILLRAATRLSAGSPVKVVIAGACGDLTYRATLCRLAEGAGERAVARLERIPDEEMPVYLRAADFAAFPFRRITNSSSVVLAQSFELPVLIPDLESLRDVPETAALRYDSTEQGLLDALELAGRMEPQARLDMGRAGKRHGDSVDWQTVAALHRDIYMTLLG